MGYSNNSINPQRGELDTKAMDILSMRKQKRAEQSASLKRKQIEREVNVMRARLALLDREIERLSVTERRSRGDISRTERELQEEMQDVLDLTKELSEHENKVKDLEKMLGMKRGAIGRLKSMISGSQNNSVSNEVSRLREELKHVDQELEQLNMKKKRIIGQMNVVETKNQKSMEQQEKLSAEFQGDQAEMSRIISDIQAEQSMMGRLKARFSREQREMLDKQKEAKEVANRLRGADSGIPSLEREKQRLEQQIQNLEKDLN